MKVTRVRAPGFTLIEVVIALFVVVVAVTATLQIMGRLTSYAGRQGNTMDLAAAVSVSQNVVDMLRDRPLPPTSRIEQLEDYDGVTRYPADRFAPEYRDYQFTVSVSHADGTPGLSDFDGRDTGLREDNLELNPHRNLLRVDVNVYKGGIHMLRIVTYKTRNGYY